MEAIQHLLHRGIFVHVQILVGVIVANHEFAQFQSPRRVSGTTSAALSQPTHHRRAPEDEGAQDDLAQLRVRLQHRAELVVGDLQHARRPTGATGDDAAPGGELAHITGEPSGRIGGNDVQHGMVKHLDGTFEHHEEGDGLVAHLEELAVGEPRSTDLLKRAI